MKRVVFCAFAAVFAVIFSAMKTFSYDGNSVSGAASTSFFTDFRNGRVYRVVEIGGKRWMAENLNYKPKAGGSWCYGDDEANCGKYGRLYEWAAAMEACPAGWHLPKRSEWDDLGRVAGGRMEVNAYGTQWFGAGAGLKSGGSAWNGGNGHGFSALPGGYRSGASGFGLVGVAGLWWTAIGDVSGGASYFRRMHSGEDYLKENLGGRGDGLSVRCVAGGESSEHAVAVSSAGGGALGGGRYVVGEKVFIKAGIAPVGRRFKGWVAVRGGGVVFADAKRAATVFIMPGNDVEVAAEFEDMVYAATVMSAGVGASGGGDYVAGAVVSIAAGKAPAGQRFGYWAGVGGGVAFGNADSAATVFAMPAGNVAVRAVFLGTFVDTRDGREYRTAVVGGRRWMAENLGYASGGSWCYGGDSANCDRYGRLYEWESAKGVCPAGSHLPVYKEWRDLEAASGGFSHAGKSLRVRSADGSGTDEYGFSALLGGGRSSGGDFYDVGKSGYWWTATESDSRYAYYRKIDSYNRKLNLYEDIASKGRGLSVRCVFDAAPEYAVTVSGAGVGAAVAGNYAVGATVAVTVKRALSGRRFKGWTAEGGGVVFVRPDSVTATFVMPARDVAVTAVFEDTSASVAAAVPVAVEDTSVSVAAAVPVVVEDTSVSVVATPAPVSAPPVVAASEASMPVLGVLRSRPIVAVYMVGKEPYGVKGAHGVMGREIAKALSGSGRYIAVDRTEAMRVVLGKKGFWGRGGVNEERIIAFSRQFGARYMCVAEVSALQSSGFRLSARLVDAVTSEAVSGASASGAMRMGEGGMAELARQVSGELLGGVKR